MWKETEFKKKKKSFVRYISLVLDILPSYCYTFIIIESVWPCYHIAYIVVSIIIIVSKLAINNDYLITLCVHHTHTYNIVKHIHIVVIFQCISIMNMIITMLPIEYIHFTWFLHLAVFYFSIIPHMSTCVAFSTLDL